jgi:hypothetical protein
MGSKTFVATQRQRTRDGAPRKPEQDAVGELGIDPGGHVSDASG